MQSELATYLPFITSGISFLTALAVAFVGVKNSRSIEASKVRSSYLNYAIQKLMDEYMKYDPLINLNGVEEGSYIRRIEKKYHECRSLIIKISPLVDIKLLEPLREIEIKQERLIKDEHNAKLAGREVTPICPDDYAKLITGYINSGHNIIKEQIAALRSQLDKAT